MSNLSDLLPAGAGGKQVDFVASGTLPSGQTVALKTNGQVEAVTGVTQGVGSESVYESANSNYTAATYDSINNKVVIVYQDNGNSNYGTAVVGTVSGTSISFGSPVVYESATVQYMSATYDSSAEKVVIAYVDNDNSYYGTAIVGTVSGTSISFGSPVVFESASSYYVTATFDSTNNKAVIAYSDGGNSNYGTAIVGTVSGTSISFGGAAVFESASTVLSFGGATYDSTNQKIVIAYRDNGNSSYGTAVVGTVSGTSISFGTPVVFEAANSRTSVAVFDPNSNKIIIAYSDVGNSYYGTAIVGTVSGTSISFGTAVVFAAASTSDHSNMTFDSTANKVVIVYQDASNSSYGTAISGAVSGTSIIFDAKIVFNPATIYYPAVTYDSTNNKAVIAYRDAGNSNYGTAVVFTVGSTNNTDFIGITDAAIANTASGSVTIKGGIATLTGATYAVTVANPGSGNRYYIDGILQQTLNLREGFTYKFDQSAGSNSGHPLRFSTTANGTHAGGSEYTTGVTTAGTPGSAGAYTQIVVAAGAPTLYYYCTNHSLMGGTANTLTGIVANSNYYVQSDGTLSTTSSTVLAGKALSSTSINLDYTT